MPSLDPIQETSKLAAMKATIDLPADVDRAMEEMDAEELAGIFVHGREQTSL